MWIAQQKWNIRRSAQLSHSRMRSSVNITTQLCNAGIALAVPDKENPQSSHMALAFCQDSYHIQTDACAAQALCFVCPTYLVHALRGLRGDEWCTTEVALGSKDGHQCPCPRGYSLLTTSLAPLPCTLSKHTMPNTQIVRRVAAAMGPKANSGCHCPCMHSC